MRGFFHSLKKNVQRSLDDWTRNRARKKARATRRRQYQKRYKGAAASSPARVVAEGVTGFFTSMTRKKMSVIASVLVVCIAVPIAVASAVDDGQGGKMIVLGSETVEASPSPDNETEGTSQANTQANNAQVQTVSAEDTAPATQTPAETQDTAEATPTPAADNAADAEASEEPQETATPSAEPEALELQYGDDSEKVAQIQQRLMELGYMEQDEPTEHFGSATRLGVQLFQRKHELEIDGIVGQTTWDLLFSDQAKKYSVSVGESGTDVEELQKRLMELGYIDTVTGYYGTDTEAAVKRFQERNGLTADGTIGEQTKEMLYSGDAKADAIDYGTESDEVKKYQERLIALGYLTEEATGLYGSNTVAAVKLFQEKNGLIADGALGPATKEALMSSDAQINALLIGDSGSEVEKAQQRLVELNYLKGYTGYFGSDTEKAVKRFQQNNGLTADGKIGPQTMQALYSDDAVAAGSASSDDSSSSSDDKQDDSSSSNNKGDSGSSSNDKKEDSGSSSSNDKKEDSSSSSSKDDEVEISGADVDSLISVAKSKLGCKYVLGAKGPNQFDCSGFVYWCLNQIGVNQSYMTSGGWKNCTKYPTVDSLSEVKKGDIIVFNGHVGIALGGGKMIDASSSDGEIRIANLSQSYWQRNFIKACRVL